MMPYLYSAFHYYEIRKDMAVPSTSHFSKVLMFRVREPSSQPHGGTTLPSGGTK